MLCTIAGGPDTSLLPINLASVLCGRRVPVHRDTMMECGDDVCVRNNGIRWAR